MTDTQGDSQNSMRISRRLRHQPLGSPRPKRTKTDNVIYLGMLFLNNQSELASTMKFVILNSLLPLVLSSPTPATSDEICKFGSMRLFPFALAPAPGSDDPLTGAGGGGSRGTLKKSKTSRYSSSLVAGVRAGVTDAMEIRCLGCLEMRKSRS